MKDNYCAWFVKENFVESFFETCEEEEADYISIYRTKTLGDVVVDDSIADFTYNKYMPTEERRQVRKEVLICLQALNGKPTKIN